MATGVIPAGPVFAAMPGLSARTVNNSAQCFVLGLPPQRDVGYVTMPTSFLLYLWNGSPTAALLTAITGDEQGDDITWDAPVPLTIEPLDSLRVTVTVGVNGPLEFTAPFTLTSSCGNMVFTITGTRAPQLAGDIGYLFSPHNWEEGLAESLAWKTDVMIAHDRTEQRVQLRTMPRRVWELRLLVSGAARRKLETIVGGRKVSRLFVPVWRDVQALSVPIAADSSVVNIDPVYFDFAEERSLAVFNSWDNFEIRRVTGIGADFITVDAPFTNFWPAGSQVAPCRYGRTSQQRIISRWTEDVAEYRLSFEPTDEQVLPTVLSPELYQTIQVCPFVPTWIGEEESVDNKWIKLDNDTGVIEIDRQALEPVFSREAVFNLFSRPAIDTFLRFLAGCAGSCNPFWLAANDRAFTVTGQVAAGATELTIISIDYEYSLLDSPARSHIELITTGGTIIRRRITGVQTLPSGEERLSLDSGLPVAVSDGVLNRAAWLELVRLASDEISLHWSAWDCLQVKLPVVVLP